MSQPNLRHRVLLGLPGLALAALSTGTLAVTADDVVCSGCIQTADIANNNVRSVDIRNYDIQSVDISPDISLGSTTASGHLSIRTTADPGALVFEADGNSAVRAVRIGRGGFSETSEDTDLIVIDPFYALNSTEPVMQMDASSGTLLLGSGTEAVPGQSGEVYIKDGAGRIGVQLLGNGQAYLGSPTTSGTLNIGSTTNTWTSIILSGSTGTLTNQFAGDGLVKAWARIHADGTVASCYRCNTAPAETQLIPGFTGQYEVDFTPVGTDISGRPWTCSLGTGSVFGAIGQIGCVQRSGDPSSIFVDTRNTAGTNANLPFTVVVY